MAKKVVGRVKSGTGKTMTRCIKMVRSEKTGAYTFKENVVLNEEVKSFFAEKQ
jgi:ABC-type polar amino acid transport system ATPase subunit